MDSNWTCGMMFYYGASDTLPIMLAVRCRKITRYVDVKDTTNGLLNAAATAEWSTHTTLVR
jgi:hypothetical protein